MSTIEKSIVVNSPVNTVYNQWTQFESFPQFMEGVEEVRQLDDKRVHWRAEIAGVEREWDAEITQQIPDRLITWRSTNGPRIIGVVTFEPVAPEQTRITLRMEYEPVGVLDKLGDFIGAIDRRIQGDLERFKEFVEERGRETGQWRGEIRDGQVRGNGDQQRGTGSTQNQYEGGGQRQSTGSTRQRGRKRAASPAAASRAGSATPSTWRSRNPFALMQQLSSEMDRLFESFFQRDSGVQSSSAQGLTPMWSPQVDVREQGDKLVVSADLPGLNKQDVKVEIGDGVLTIQGERRDERESEEEGFRRVERAYGSFYRAIPLPEGVNPEAVEAHMENGVLEVVLSTPQQSRQHGRQVEIR
jgi:HSP20 family molecular chaperone IbpA/ribosome-associated toxin RatA of RatAB toxin-antitoxin module